MRSAKELCAMLITRSLKELTEEEEDVVVDYLEDIGIDVDLDTKSKELCLMLLEKSMEQEIGRKVPISAYANSLISKEAARKTQKESSKEKQELFRKRKSVEKELQELGKNLPGCVVSNPPIFSKTLYDIDVDPNLGIQKLGDGSSQYISLVSISENLYSQVFLTLTNPVLEITTSQGYKSYARIGQPHPGPDNLIYVSPLVGTLLNLKGTDGGLVKLCSSLPEIGKVEFTYYGKKDDLDKLLPILRSKLPNVINAFSYLSLGMILVTDVNGKEIQIRVDRLENTSGTPIFAGLLPFGETDLPFEIFTDN